MYKLKYLLVCFGTFCLISSGKGATEADVQRVLQQIQGKLVEVENHLSTLQLKLKEAYPTADRSHKHQEQPQLLPADQPHRQPANRPAPVHPDAGIEKRGTKDVEHSHPSHKDSQRLNDFKNSLTPEQLEALKNHYSKSGLIEAILKQRPVPTLYKRNHLDTSKLSPEMQEYYKHLTPEQQELLKNHPSQGSHLSKALEDSKRPVPEEEADSDVKKRELNPETDWAAILEDMWTHINALKDVTKRATTHHERDSHYSEELADKILQDIKKAKDSGVKLEDLLASLGHHKAAPKNGAK